MQRVTLVPLFLLIKIKYADNNAHRAGVTVSRIFAIGCTMDDFTKEAVDLAAEHGISGQYYNERRPHSAPNYQTPAEFAACCRQKRADEASGPERG